MHARVSKLHFISRKMTVRFGGLENVKVDPQKQRMY